MIKLKGKDLQDLYNGTINIKRVRWTNANGTPFFVWDNLIVYDLGTGQSFNVRNVYSNYSQLRKGNFFITTMDEATCSSRVVVTTYMQYLNLKGNFYKSYNSSSGVLTAYNNAVGNLVSNRGDVHAYLVVNTDKLIDLGTAQSFNVKSYANYKKFTSNNFFIAEADDYEENRARTYEGTWTGSCTMKLYKSYNTSKGLLTCYYYETGSNNSGSTDFLSRKMDVHVYLNPKGL